MESVPLLPKAKVQPNLNVAPLLRELFQEEFQTPLPSKGISQNILTSLKYEKLKGEDQETFRSVDYLQNLTKRRDSIFDFAENVFEAYERHESDLKDIREAEKNIFETHVHYVRREIAILENCAIRDLLSLKRQPLFRSLDANYVKKYKLLQGDAGLPPVYEANSDFRTKNFKKWRRKLEDDSQENLTSSCLEKVTLVPCEQKEKKTRAGPRKQTKIRKPRPKNSIVQEKKVELFKAEPQIVFFSDYKLGDVYSAQIQVRNVHTKALQFHLKPMCPNGPFNAKLKEKDTAKISPGLTFQINVEFTPKSLENAMEDIIIQIEDGNRVLIPLVAYLEPPVLKTHSEIFEFTKIMKEKIASSCIECGPCFTGDSKVTKLRFHCPRGSGEFFIMSSENWSTTYIDTVTSDNILEIPPFRVYPVFFKIEKNEVIDLFVEFLPKNSGTHVENIMIACNNGEIRSLDLLADAVGWHGYFFSFQDSLLKNLPPDMDDDIKVKYYLDFEDVMPTGKVEKVFCVSNNSNMSFEFQWKIREANILGSPEKYLKLSKYQVKIDPESGTFEANSIWEFLVTITFNEGEIGDYRMVLSLYVLNLPYQCIEEDNTIIQPTGLVRNLYSQSLYGEEEYTVPSPELLSLQGTYESLQESIKSYVECQSKVQMAPRQDFCKTTCIPNPGLCAKPLKKSKTLFNIGETTDDEGLSCACRLRPMEGESVSESCSSNVKEIEPPRNEVIWDFVDILVDEIELWVEVTEARVTMEPSIIELGNPLIVDDSPIIKSVTITNHNRSPVACSWIKPQEYEETEKNTIVGNQTRDQFSVSLLFDNKSGNKKKEQVKSTANDMVNMSDHEELNEMSSGPEESKSIGSKACRVVTDPQERFTIPGFSELTCSIAISALQPGKIRETLNLSVNGGSLLLNLLIFGTTIRQDFNISPEILDFGILKQGTRYVKELQIIKETPDPLLWTINQFKFDFKTEKFFGDSDTENQSNIKREGVIRDEGVAVESYQLDARAPGISLSLLEVQGRNLNTEEVTKQYILALANVKLPILSLSSPRFENAILAPPGMMYVGKPINTRVILKNNGEVETFFTWGHPFGCHSRKIKINISPNGCRIEPKKKMTITVELIPLDEGIISHCYIPCFFCRSGEPLILSIVGIAEKVNVTLEIIDYPGQTHADPSSFLRSPFYHTVLRMPWPLKIYDPNLSYKYYPEKHVLSMNCKCMDVEEEANRVFGYPPTEPESTASDKSQPYSEVGEESGRILISPSLKKSSTRSESLKDLMESPEVEKQTSENSVQRFMSSTESFQWMKPQMEFLNVPSRSPVLRQLVIRNETPVETSFQIRVPSFGVAKRMLLQSSETGTLKSLSVRTDSFEEKLEKDQPLVIVVEPSQGELLGNDAVCINVYAYGNTWGEYRDLLVCNIRGIETAYLKIFVQIVGHPIYFPIFDTHKSIKPILRFEPSSPTTKPLSKRIKVVNRSSISLTVSWIVFLTEPLPEEEEQEENACAEYGAQLDSNHSREESTNSTKVYIPKNVSESASSFRNMIDMKSDFSQMSGTNESFAKSDSVRNDNRETKDGEKMTGSSVSDEAMKGETPQMSFPGRLDTRFFQVDPKEISFEPFEEKYMTVTFDSGLCKPENFSQEFKAVLTGCVKLSPQDEKLLDIYYRPCGINFVSELMDFSALVETPLLSLEILKGDLKFIVDANAVIKAPSKKVSLSRKYLLKNNKEKSVSMKIEVMPGVIFRVKTVNTLYKLYRDYNPETHTLIIDPGQVLEMELICSVTYKDVIYAFEQLKQKRKREQQAGSPYDMKTSNASEVDEELKGRVGGEPWQQFFNCPDNQNLSAAIYNLCHKDSFELNINRMSSKSDMSACLDIRGYSAEVEGEYFELPYVEEPGRQKFPHHVTIVEEEICFVQAELLTQSIMVELHLSFPAVRLSAKCLDFGNVYIETPAVRYFSILNVTGFPTDFRVKAKYNASPFVADPLTGSLPATNYNSDIGRTIAITFKPSQPGYFKEVFQVFLNPDMEFDFQEIFVAGFGTWNERYKPIKFETGTKLEGIYPTLQK